MKNRRVYSVCCMQDAVIARTDSGSESFWKSDVCGLSVEGKVRGDGGCDVCDFLEPFFSLCSIMAHRQSPKQRGSKT